jgi:N,N'-diacetyllegionaminate synthase
MKIKIDGKSIGEGFPTYIVAEGGINHNGSVKIAKEIIKKATKSGANAIKFQSFKAEDLTSEHSKYYKLFKKLELTDEKFTEIFDYGKSLGTTVFSSPFSNTAIDFLEKQKVPAFKIASGDITNLPLIKYASLKNKTMIISTGMSTMKEVEEAVNEIKKTKNKKIILMHSVSSYPTPFNEVNLQSISSLKKKFSFPVGFSDNGSNNLVPVIAVSQGANIIEKHFTINKKLKGPDHKISADPKELSQIIKNIRDVETMLGDGIKNYQKSEKENRIHVRRSLTAKMDISKNMKITEKMIAIKRPATGIEPKYFSKIIGKQVIKKINENDSIKLNYLKEKKL